MTIMHTPGFSGCVNLCVDAAATQFGGLQIPERTLGHGDRSDEWLGITQPSNEKGYRGTLEDFVRAITDELNDFKVEGLDMIKKVKH